MSEEHKYNHFFHQIESSDTQESYRGHAQNAKYPQSIAKELNLKISANIK
jgi:hypothetical protein